MITKKIICFCILCGIQLLMAFYAVCQTAQPAYKFRTFSPEGGFYYDGVSAVRQDSAGFIWIMMDKELFRFDGYQFTRYYNYFRKLDEKRNWTFRSLKTDANGRLYLVANNGLFKHHPDTDRFECLIDTVGLQSVLIDPGNNIWLNIQALNKFDPVTQKPVEVTSGGKPIRSTSSLFYFENQLFASTYYGKTHLEMKSGEFTLYGSLPNDYYVAQKLSGDILWALNRKGELYKVNFRTFGIIHKYTFCNGTNFARCMEIDKTGKIWIGTQNGLFVFAPDTETSEHYRMDEKKFSIPNNSVWTIHSDRRGNIWLGTYSGGLCYVNLDEENIFFSYPAQKSGLSHKVISGFSEDDRYLWIGTEGGGVDRMDKQSGEVRFFGNEMNNSNSLANNNVKPMVFDKNCQCLWIPMYIGGLDCYDVRNQVFTHYKDKMHTNDLRKIIAEQDSGLWIIYQYAQPLVCYFSYERKSFEHIYPEVRESDFLFDICRDRHDRLWIIGQKKLYAADIAGRTLKPVSSDFQLNGQAVYADDSNRIWIGTIGRGLICYSPVDSVFRVYDGILKFGVNTIFSICADNDQNLWMGTDNGLFCYRVNANQWLRFDQNDGIQGNVFYPIASMKGQEGRLYFGGTNGFTIVDTENISLNRVAPNAVIADILVNNISLSGDHLLNKASGNELILQYDQNNVTVVFSSDSYLMPLKNRYRYRLKGYNDQWLEVDALSRNAGYTKLPAGKYTFEVLASNNDGVWSEYPATIVIRCLPAPWLSWKAYLLYALALSGILFLVFRYYFRQRELKLALYKEGLAKKQQDEVHQSQLRFFTNISHEFKTPLSLIIAVLDTLRKDGLKEYYYHILNNNSQRLLHLVNELMLFRTVENGKLPLRLQLSDVNAFITGVASDFSDFAQQHDIRFTVYPDQLLSGEIPADRMILEKIIMNLTSNAFRYTPDGGAVTICTYSDPEQYHPSYQSSYTVGNDDIPDPFCIVIRDTGIGISGSSIDKIFDRFYKVETSVNKDLGTGIGLALVKSLVLLHRGAITVYSSKEAGSEMVITLSKQKTYYTEQDFSDPVHTDLEQIIESYDISRDDTPVDDLYLREEKRILVAEDNEDLRGLIVTFLSSYYDVVEAQDGAEAFRLLHEMEVDLVISDIMMPLKDGITLCREIKDDINTSYIPFIMLTAKTGQESEMEGIHSGADIYMEKPVKLNLLLQIIRNIFRQQERLREYYSKHHFADSGELPANKQDNLFLKKLYDILDANLDNSGLDVNFIASELSMSKSKLYMKLKSVTGKSVVEIILNYRMRKAARLIVEQDSLSMREVMEQVGIESQSYFTRMFKKEFGETPKSFSTRQKQDNITTQKE